MARSQDGGDLGLEFVRTDPFASSDPDEELVVVGGGRVRGRRGGGRPHRPARRGWSDLPIRWRRVLALTGAFVVLLAATVAIRSHQAPQPIAAPHPKVSVPAGPSLIPSVGYTSGPPGAPPPYEGFPMALPAGNPLDVTISSTSLYVLLGTELVMIDAYSGDVVRAVAVNAGPNSRLVLDDADGAIWVVTEKTSAGIVHEFDTATLSQSQAVTVPAMIYDAAILDGNLFLATAAGVEQLSASTGALNPVMATNPPAEVLAAYPLSDTVYALTSGPTGRLIALSADGNTLLAGPVLDISQPSLAVVGNQLWVGGVGAAGVVTRVDPATMAPLTAGGAAVAVTAPVGSGARVEAGANDIWVYSPSTSVLYCVDTRTGRELQHWPQLSGPVTAGGSGPYAIGRRLVWPLVLAGACTG